MKNISLVLFLKSQKEANFSKDVNIIHDKKPILNINNGNSLNNNRDTKLFRNGSELNYDNKRDTTINSTSYNFNTSLNNYVDYTQLKNISLCSIDDKYKNLENPFANPEIPRNPDEERRSKIIERINKDRNNKFKSQSVDSIRHIKNVSVENRTNYLGNQLFREGNEE